VTSHHGQDERHDRAGERGGAEVELAGALVAHAAHDLQRLAAAPAEVHEQRERGDDAAGRERRAEVVADRERDDDGCGDQEAAAELGGRGAEGRS